MKALHTVLDVAIDRMLQCGRIIPNGNWRNRIRPGHVASHEYMAAEICSQPTD